MSKQKPIRTFIAKGNKGVEYTVNVFSSIINLTGNTTPCLTYKDEVYYTADEIELLPVEAYTLESKDGLSFKP